VGTSVREASIRIGWEHMFGAGRGEALQVLPMWRAQAH